MENEDFFMDIDLIECYGVPRVMLEIQDNMDRTALNIANTTVLDE